jgi:hypothetical protein
MKRYARARKLYDGKLLFEQAPVAWQKIMRYINRTEHMFNRWYDENQLLQAVKESVPDEVFTWHLNWAMMYKDMRSFLRFYEKFTDSRRLEHACYAAQGYAAQGEHEKALRTLFAAREYPMAYPQLEYDAEAVTTHTKKIIVGEAKPIIPF